MPELKTLSGVYDAGVLLAVHGERGDAREWVDVDNLCEYAARSGDLLLLKRARALDPPAPWSWFTCGFAAERGRLAVLQWMHAQEPQWLQDAFICACAAAAFNGHVHVTKWLHSLPGGCGCGMSKLFSVCEGPNGAASKANRRWHVHALLCVIALMAAHSGVVWFAGIECVVASV